MSDSSWPHVLQPTRLLCPWDFPGKSTGVGCHCLLHSTSIHAPKPQPQLCLQETSAKCRQQPLKADEPSRKEAASGGPRRGILLKTCRWWMAEPPGLQCRVQAENLGCRLPGRAPCWAYRQDDGEARALGIPRPLGSGNNHFPFCFFVFNWLISSALLMTVW